MDDGSDDHRHAAPGMQIIPGLTSKQDLNVIQWISSTLEATRRREEEVNPDAAASTALVKSAALTHQCF